MLPMADDNATINTDDESPTTGALQRDQQKPRNNEHGLTPSEWRIFQVLDKKLQAHNIIQRANTATSNEQKRENNERSKRKQNVQRPPTAQELIRRAAINTTWPTGSGTNEQKTTQFMHEWQQQIDWIKDDTPTMAMAIEAAAGQIGPHQLRANFRHALRTNYLEHADSHKQRQWEHRCRHNLGAASLLLKEAAQIIDMHERWAAQKAQRGIGTAPNHHTNSDNIVWNAYHREKQHQRQSIMTHKESRRYNTRGHGVQVNAVTHAFLPESNLSADEVANMDSSSEEDAYPAQTMWEMWSAMQTQKREETYHELQLLADQAGQITGNPIIAVLKKRGAVQAQKPKILPNVQKAKTRS